MSHFNLEGQTRTASNQSLVNSRIFVVQPVKSYSHRMHETASIFGSLGTTSNNTSATLTGGNTGGNHDEEEFVQPITKVDDWTVPDRYTVKPGDTYASIAQSQYGDPTFGPQIALNNNDPADTIQPDVCKVLKLPQYMPTNNRSTNYLPEEKFNNAIIGNIYPPLIFAQPHRHKHSCVQTLVSVAISVVVTVAASALVGTCPAAAPMLLLAHSLEVAMVAAILDAGAQAVAVKLGALKEFSIQSMIETSLAAGAFYGMSMAFKGSAAFTKLATQTAAAGAGDLSSQLVEMATGLRKRLDIRQTLLSMATTLIDTPLNDSLPFQVKVNDPRIGRKIVMALMDDFADAYANAYIGSAIMGGKPDLEDALGQALGSFFGSQIGDWIESFKKPVLGWGAGAEVTNDNPIHDYHSALMDAKPDITYQDLEEKMGIHDLADEDFTQDLTSDSNKPIGSDQAPKSSAAKPSTSVAPPNSYVTNTQLAERQIGAMLAQNMQGYFPDTAVFNTVPGYTSASNNPQLLSMMLQIMKNVPLLPFSFSISQMEMGSKSLYQMMQPSAGLGVIDSYLRPIAELNPIVSLTNAVFGTDILQNNRPLSVGDRVYSGINTASFFGGEIVAPALKGWDMFTGELSGLWGRGASIFKSSVSPQTLITEAEQIIQPDLPGFGKLAGKNVIITQKGLDIVEKHLTNTNALGTPDTMYNDLMVERLRSALKLNKPLTGADAIFYTHEVAEATYMSKGLSQDIAHVSAIAKYQVSPYSIYHPDVIEALPGEFTQPWKQFWASYKPVIVPTNQIPSVVYQH